MSGALDGIAQGMRTQLDKVEKGALSRALFGGLVLVYERNGSAWRLAIGRTGTPPSKTEARVIGDAFGLPAGVEWQWIQRKNAKRRLVYQVAECTWIERRQIETESEDTP